MARKPSKSQSELPALLKEEEDTARQLYQDWVNTVNPALYAAWKEARSDSHARSAQQDEYAKKDIWEIYKACVASGDERKRSAYAAHLMEVGAKQCRLNTMFSDVKVEMQSAIHTGVAKTIAYADPNHGSITGYLRTVLRGEKDMSLRMQGLPLSTGGRSAWVDIHRITKETKREGVILSDVQLKERLTERTWESGEKRHTQAAIEEALRYRALGARALVSIDIPTRGDEGDIASLRAQKIEFAIFGANNTDTVALIHRKKLEEAFRDVAKKALSRREYDLINYLLDGGDISDLAKKTDVTRQSLEYRRKGAIDKLRRGLSDFNDIPKAPPSLPRSKPSSAVEKKKGTVAELTYKRVFGLRIDSHHTIGEEKESEFMRRFHQTIQEKLTRQQQRVVTALFVEGKATKEVAVAMEVSESSVSKWKSVAFAVLRRELADFNKDCKPKNYWLDPPSEKPFTP